jgi:hypothetical protein
MNEARGIGQIIGTLLFVGTCGIPAMHLAGFYGGTTWPLIRFLSIAAIGGLVGGALLARGHRVAGAVGGLIAGPLGLLAIYFYARNRQSIYQLEVMFVQLVAALPGLAAYGVLRLLTDALFPPRRVDEPYEDEHDEPRPKRRRRIYDEEEDDEPRPKRRRYEDES